MTQKTDYRAFSILVMVFFFWGFVAASNDILIPVFKEKLNLVQWESQMISFAFYVAYTVGSLIYFFLSRRSKGGDILNKIGYKNGIILGLCISAFGTLLFLPAAEMESFPLMISGLFIVGLGFSLQQTAANPLAIHLGEPSKGSQRLSLAGGVNNIGTTIGPILVSLAIFGSVTVSNQLSGIQAVKMPYLILGAAFLLVAILIKFSPLPNSLEGVTHAETVVENSKKEAGLKEYPQLWMGMIAIFLYVGVEVSTAANLPEFMKVHLQTKTSDVAPYVSLFWASLMIGRWTASVGAFPMSKDLRSVLAFVVPYIAFGVFLGVNAIASHDIQMFYIYAAIIPVLIVADIISKGDPARQLFIFSLAGIAALLTGIFANGMVSVFAFISVGLFCSTLWPCIFALAINKLGPKTNTGSSLLIMMIMGGGVISLLQGFLAHKNLLGIQHSYFVGVVCFAYLAFYAIKMAKIWRPEHALPEHPDMLDA